MLDSVKHALEENTTYKSSFQSTGGTRPNELLDLIHSDVCGKINAKSIGGAEYFLTFIDNKHVIYV